MAEAAWPRPAREALGAVLGLLAGVARRREGRVGPGGRESRAAAAESDMWTAERVTGILFHGVLAALVLLGARDVFFQYEENQCSMTYMFDYPEYLVSGWADGRRHLLQGVPFCFPSAEFSLRGWLRPNPPSWAGDRRPAFSQGVPEKLGRDPMKAARSPQPPVHHPGLGDSSSGGRAPLPCALNPRSGTVPFQPLPLRVGWLHLIAPAPVCLMMGVGLPSDSVWDSPGVQAPISGALEQRFSKCGLGPPKPF